MDGTAGYYAYTVLGFIADVIAKFLMPSKRPPSDFVTISDLDDLSNDEIIELMGANRTRTLSDEAGVDLGDNSISLVTDTAVMKWILWGEFATCEALTYDLVFHHTTIPVPRVGRVIHRDTGSAYFTMDRVRGRQLAQVWPTLSILGKIRIAFILRHYISQLRVIRHPRSAIPGPVASGAEAIGCDCPLFGDIGPLRGPFASNTEFSAFLNSKFNAACEYERRRGKGGSDMPSQPFDDSRPLVLTHCDLNMRNILVGDDGRLWLIDWAWSGFYPEWFEYAAMRRTWDVFGQYTGQDPVWMLLMPFICGPYFSQWRWYCFMAHMFDYGN